MGSTMYDDHNVTGQANTTPTYGSDDIAVVGMSVNVAGAGDVEKFWDLLLHGESQHIEVPAHRFTFKSTAGRPVDPERKWYGNFIDDFDAFDHKFFKRSPKEALYADPQQRLFLQCAYQAVEQSGYLNLPNPDKRIGVYVGVGSAEYEPNFASHQANAFSATGNLKSAIPGRVSHYFGWTGPGLAVDTACASSAVAIHLACRAVASGDCTAALVGGTQIINNPFHFQNLAGASFLSLTGPCKPFDVRADGYCRGEGIGAVFIKRMSDALKDGDNILGCIASTAVLQNDNSTPMFVPNADSLASLFDTVITSARLSPKDIAFVEAHGTGTKVGDPAEFESIRRVLGASLGRANPLPVCSVKSLIGHTESASGLISLIKILLMIHHGIIPKQVGFKDLNPDLNSSVQDMIEVPRENRNWKAGFKAALINSFGASGSNCAMVIKKHSIALPHGDSFETDYPFWITGMDTRSLIAYAAKFAQFVKSSEASVADLAYNLSKQSNRTLPKSVVFHARGRPDLIAKLKQFVKDEESLEILSVKDPRPVILCFGGQTTSAVGLSRQLFDRSLLLQKHLNACETILNRHEFGSLYPSIFQEEPLQDTAELQIALFALQYACAQAWIDSGIQVATIIGHSFGELACLTISGSISLENAIIAVQTRATLVRDNFGPDTGAMIAVEGNLDDVRALIEASRRSTSINDQMAEIACYNGPTSFTLAGPSLAIDAVDTILPQFGGLKSKRLTVTNAFHSSLVEPLMSKLGEISQSIQFGHSKIPWERSIERDEDAKITSDFFAKHMRQPVHAYSAFKRLHARFPSAIWLEAGSGSTITRMARKALRAPSSSYFQSVDICNTENAVVNLTAVTENLWKEGVNMVYWLHHISQKQEYQHVLLPPYQFEKTRHWLELKDSETTVLSHKVEDTPPNTNPTPSLCSFAGYLDSSRRSACYQLNTSTEPFKDALLGRKMTHESEPSCSITLAVSLAIEAHCTLLPEVKWLKVEHEAKNVASYAPLTSIEARKLWITIHLVESLHQDAWRWIIYSTDHLDNGRVVHFEGDLVITTGHELSTYQRLVTHKAYQDLATCDDPDDAVQGKDVYKVFDDIVQHSTPYRGFQKLARKSQQAAGRIRMMPLKPWISDPYLLDCITQISTYWIHCTQYQDFPEVYTITGIQRWIHLPTTNADHETASSTLIRDVYATHLSSSDNAVLADIFVFDHDKQLVDLMIGVRFERMLQNGPISKSTRSNNSSHNHMTPKVSTADATTRHQALPIARDPDSFTNQASNLRSSQESIKSEQSLETGITTPATTEQHQSKNTTASTVLETLANLSCVDKADITLEAELANIGIDSLVEIELLSDLRKRCGNDTFSIHDWGTVVTVRDLVDRVGSSLVST